MNSKNPHVRSWSVVACACTVAPFFVALTAAGAALALASCGSTVESDPCSSIACGSGMQCVNGSCVASNPGPDGGVEASGGKDAAEGGTPLDVTTNNDGEPTEATECFKGDFPWTNTQEAYTVPPGARWMHVKAWGGGANQEGTCSGGAGGYTEAVFEVIPGTELVFIVGAPGHAADEKGQMLLGFGQTGGSGLTGVFSGPGLVKEGEYDKAWLIAGGGGGSGVATGGPCIPGVPGNHPTAGGMSTMMGGLGLDDNVNGGGGGYRGGKGGAKGEKGFGGTGFVDTNRTKDYQMANAEPGDDYPPNAGDADYKNDAGMYERPGLLVVKFTCDKPIIEPPK